MDSKRQREAETNTVSNDGSRKTKKSRAEKKLTSEKELFTSVEQQAAKLLAEFKGYPILALWHALTRTNYEDSASIAVAIVKHRACGLERVAESSDEAKIAVPKFHYVGYGATPLLLATHASRLDVVKALIDLGADTKRANEGGTTALHIAAGMGNIGLMDCLLKNGADMHVRDYSHRSVLGYALGKKNSNAVRYLLDLGADVRPDKHGSLLGFARGKEFTLLLRYGADTTKTIVTHGSPLHTLASKLWVDLTDEITLLIDNGADIESRDALQQTPLAVASSFSRGTVVDTLLENGANINTKDKQGRTALMLSLLNLSDAVVPSERLYDTFFSLTDFGADIAATDEKGWTALHYLISGGDNDEPYQFPFLALYELLALGANVDAKDASGRTPWDVRYSASSSVDECKMVLEILRSAGFVE